MDKQRYFTIFSMIAFGSRDTLEHSISPLIGTLGDLDSLKEKILSDLKETPVEAPEEILKSLDFEAFEKARLGYHSVGVSLIICCSELIKKIAGDRASANKHFGMTSQKAFEFYRLGPRINGVPWAEGVVCASNYVRHDDEWQELVNPISKKEDRTFVESLTSMISPQRKNELTCQLVKFTSWTARAATVHLRVKFSKLFKTASGSFPGLCGPPIVKNSDGSIRGLRRLGLISLRTGSLPS